VPPVMALGTDRDAAIVIADNSRNIPVDLRAAGPALVRRSLALHLDAAKQ